MNEEAREIADRLRAARNLLVVSHARADGDAMGSSMAVAAAARAAGTEAAVVLHEPLPEHLAALADFSAPTVPAAAFADAAATADLVLIVDTCSYRQLGDIADHLDRFKSKTAVIDHHQTADDIGAVRWIDTTAAAVGVMIFELFEPLGWTVGGGTAEPLAAAILTDTGWLRFDNTDGRCLRVVARLVDAGVSPAAMFKRIYQSDRIEKLRLLARALDGMQLHGGGRLAVMTLTAADFAQTGADEDETENIVNEAMRIGEVDTAAIFVENDDGVRVSLRSRERVDVAAVAAAFGGGGHARAAGFRHAGALAEIRAAAVTVLERKLAAQA